MSEMQGIRRAAEILSNARHCVVFSGAGCSTPSGIPDFRSTGSGIWTTVDPMEVGSINAFRRNPKAFYEWFRPRVEQMERAEPNTCHYALAALQRQGALEAIITQNIDDLHQRAGSEDVIPLHGSIHHSICTQCLHRVGRPEAWAWLYDDQNLPQCSLCSAPMKPDVVLFGEQLDARVWLQARTEAERCDVMTVVGSSLQVYPAAELPSLALGNGASLIIVNLSETHLDRHADVVLHQDVSVALPAILQAVNDQRGAQ